MPRYFEKIANQFGRPLRCLGALGLGCALAGSGLAQSTPSNQFQTSRPTTATDENDEFQFKSLMPLPRQQTQQPQNKALKLLQRQQETPGVATASTAWEAPKTPSSTTIKRVSWQQPNETSSRNNNTAQALPRVASLPSTTAPATLPKTHQLQNVDIRGFETAIVQGWGSRVKTASSPDARFVRVEFPTRINADMTMVIDRQTETLTFEGDQVLHDSWYNMVNQIDSLPKTTPDGSVEHAVVVDRGHAEMATIRQVAFLMGYTQQQDQLQLPPGTKVPATDQFPKNAQTVKDRVKIVEDPRTGAVTLIGAPEDIKIVSDIILKILAEAKANQPQVTRIPLGSQQSEAIAAQVQSIYDTTFSPSTGPATIEPLASPNSLVIVGQPEAIDAIREIVKSIDVEASPDEASGFKAFRLKFLSAADAKVRLDTYFSQANLGQGANQLPSVPVTTIADFRSNVIVVKGAVQFIKQAETFLNQIDVADSSATNEVRIIPLRNTVAEDIAIVIQDAINGQQPNSGQGFNPNQQANQNQNNANVNSTPNQSTLRSPALSLKTIDGSGQEINGGIMFDVRVTADRNSNSLIVTGPEASMDLVEALVKQLDRLPNAETQIKVFEILNGDAQQLLTMLQQLFGADGAQGQQQQQQGANFSQLPLQSASAVDGAALVNLRFSVDTRTNTIIAVGPVGDLQVVEDLLNRLDEQDTNTVRAGVYRLSNAPALDVADAINNYLDSRNNIASQDPRVAGGINLSNGTAIVVPEVVSNSLIVRAVPELRDEIEEIIHALDRRPPLVNVKVLIAEVDLNALEEFGVDLGLQDSLLFDRGTTVGPAGDIAGGIGFPFNSGAIANANATFPGTLAGQALSNLATGRINPDLGFGGFVLSAGSDSVNILLRALENRSCIRVLSKPHIMTIENLQGRVSIGAEVPRVSGTTNTNFGVTQNVEFVDVGVILEVTPRVSPDGMIVMGVNTIKSSVGPDETGITIAIGADGTPITSPQIIETEANTTVMARSGQTVVFSGLIQEQKTHVERGTPILSDLPVIGPLFKFESDEAIRSELLIIMTPTIVSEDGALDAHNQDELSRMHWCLSDVAEVYGNTDFQGHYSTGNATEIYYPDSDPAGLSPVGPETDGSFDHQGGPAQGSGSRSGGSSTRSSSGSGTRESSTGGSSTRSNVPVVPQGSTSRRAPSAGSGLRPGGLSPATPQPSAPVTIDAPRPQ